MGSSRCLRPVARLLRASRPTGRQGIDNTSSTFGKAQWIEPAESPAPIAYFRKEIYLNSSPEQAWIEIAASDNFGLDRQWAHHRQSRLRLRPSKAGIYDIKRALKPGTNVIAVSISRTSYPGSSAAASFAVRLSAARRQRHSRSFRMKPWRVTNRTGIVASTEEWNSKRDLGSDLADRASLAAQ